MAGSCSCGCGLNTETTIIYLGEHFIKWLVIALVVRQASLDIIAFFTTLEHVGEGLPGLEERKIHEAEL